MAEELRAKSVRDLREILDRSGISYADCIEKEDLVQKILTHNLSERPAHVKKQLQTVEGLRCIIVERGSSPQLIAIVLHGFGANAADLESIGEEIFSAIPAGNVRFIFPDAPIRLGGESYAWWNIDIQDLIIKAMSGLFDDIVDSTPPGLAEARSKVTALIAHQQKETGLPLRKFVICGFSQGAMLTVDTAIRLPEPVGFIGVFSGTAVSRVEWKRVVESKEGKLKGLQVVQSHGTSDPIVPFPLGKILKEFLEGAGASVQFIEFNGPHTIPHKVIVKVLECIREVLAAPK